MLNTFHGPGSVPGAREAAVAETLVGEKDTLGAQPNLAMQVAWLPPPGVDPLVWVRPPDDDGVAWER